MADETGTPGEIVTRTRRYFIGEDGILRAITLPGTEDTLDDAVENVRAMTSLAKGRRLPVLADSRCLKAVSREARAYYASPEGAANVLVVAVVIRSVVQRVISNWFLTVNKPRFPIRLFNTEDEALAWLEEVTRSR